MKAKELIQQNPYRVMGVSANAPLVLISTQNSWMKAYAAIGKAVYCPHDMTPVFGDSPSRKTGDLAAALAALSTPMSRLTNGMFWFMNLTETDPEAFTILASEGDIKSAVRTWETDPHGMSSLQNRLVCCLLRGSRYYAEALRLASELYTVYGAEFIRRISNGFDVIPPERLMSVFLRETAGHLEAETGRWDKAVERLGDDTVSLQWAEAKADRLVEALKKAVAVAKTTEIHVPKDHYRIADTLRRQSEPLLIRLRQLRNQHPVLLSRYASMANEVCNEVSSRGICYHNETFWFPGKREKVLKLEQFCYRYTMSIKGKRTARTNVNMSLSRRDDAPLFPNGTPDNLNEDDRKKANAGIGAILNALARYKNKG